MEHVASTRAQCQFALQVASFIHPPDLPVAAAAGGAGVGVVVGGGGAVPAAAGTSRLKQFYYEIIALTLVILIDFSFAIYFWGHPFTILSIFTVTFVFLSLFIVVWHNLIPKLNTFREIASAITVISFFSAALYFILPSFHYFLVKDCLEYPVKFQLPTPLVPHPSLESLLEEMINLSLPKESIQGIAGPMYQGKTTAIQKNLNGRKHTIVTDVGDVAAEDLESHLISFFSGSPPEYLLFPMRMNFKTALATLSDVAQSYSKNPQERLIIVIDGAKKLYGDIDPSAGKTDAPFVHSICTKLSPHALVIFIFSGSTILNKSPHVSHVGGRTNIELSEPIANNTVMLEWFLQHSGTEGLSHRDAEKIVNVLNGNFRDYEKLLSKAKMRRISIHDSFLLLHETTHDFLLSKLQLDDIQVRSLERKPIEDVQYIVERYDLVRRLAGDELHTYSRDTHEKSQTKTNGAKTKATNPVVTGLVEDNILVPYPNNEIKFESNLMKTVAKTLVEDPHIIENVEKLRAKLK
jgi:hypothetical protein